MLSSIAENPDNKTLSLFGFLTTDSSTIFPCLHTHITSATVLCVLLAKVIKQHAAPAILVGRNILTHGIDTPAERIVSVAKENDIKIVALSGVLTLALNSMKAAVQAIRDAGLNDVRVIVGGAPVDETACDVTGADEWARSPQKTVQVCKRWATA